jgi:hypothetical protein
MTTPPTRRTRSLRLISASAPRRWMAAGLVLASSAHAWAFQTASVNSASGTRQAAGGGAAPGGAPELNPALIWGAAILLVGGVLILTSRRRRSGSAAHGGL